MFNTALGPCWVKSPILITTFHGNDPTMVWQAVSKEGVGKWVPETAVTVGDDGIFFSLTVYCPAAKFMGLFIQPVGEQRSVDFVGDGLLGLARVRLGASCRLNHCTKESTR
jgi:hypothetical protein